MPSLASRSNPTTGTTTHHVLSRVRRSVMRWVIGHLVSRHAKRVLFFSSLYSKVMRLDDLSDEAIALLNQVMGLARRPDALRMGHFARELIWNDTDVEVMLSEELFNRELTPAHTKRISEALVAQVPHFIMYGRSSDVVRDIEKLIAQGSQLSAAA